MSPHNPSIPLCWDSLKRIHDHFASIAFDICAQGNEVEPQLFTLDVTIDDPLSKIVATSPAIVKSFLNSTRSKIALATLMKNLLNPQSKVAREHKNQHGFFPGLLVQINEAWMSTKRNGTNHVAPSLDSDRKEVLLIILHTCAMSIPVVHMIVSTPRRHCLSADFPAYDSVPGMKGSMNIFDPETSNLSHEGSLTNNSASNGDLREPTFH